MIRGVHHVSISTNNFEKMLHFYRDLIGLPFSTSYDWEPGNHPADSVVGLNNSSVRTALLRAGNTFVEIFQYLNPVGKDSIPNRPACDAGITHICFDVINVDEEYERLLDAGITFHTPPVDVGGVVRTTYGRDPDGNIFELQEIIAPDLPQDLSTVIPDMKDLKIK
jgi:catechol 2,3-dioxygenase-like lactoylglutathione lyase family enzyme